jgi:hypothetical protein
MIGGGNMSDSKVRRVSSWNHDGAEVIVDAPNGTHYLVPVEMWERVVGALRELSRAYSKDTPSGMAEIARRALAEIGGGDE